MVHVWRTVSNFSPACVVIGTAFSGSGGVANWAADAGCGCCRLVTNSSCWVFKAWICRWKASWIGCTAAAYSVIKDAWGPEGVMSGCYQWAGRTYQWHPAKYSYNQKRLLDQQSANILNQSEKCLPNGLTCTCTPLPPLHWRQRGETGYSMHGNDEAQKVNQELIELL